MDHQIGCVFGSRLIVLLQIDLIRGAYASGVALEKSQHRPT